MTMIRINTGVTELTCFCSTFFLMMLIIILTATTATTADKTKENDVLVNEYTCILCLTKNNIVQN